MPESIYEIVKDTPQAVVIYCSDPRFQSAFQQFIEQEIGLAVGEYIPIVVPGGPGNLGRPKTNPLDFSALLKQVEFFLQRNKTKKIILINHQDCGYYKKINEGYKHILLEDKDMKKIYSILKEKLSSIKPKIEMYCATFVSADKVCFKKIPKK